MRDAHEVVAEDHLGDGDSEACGHGVDGSGFEDGEFEGCYGEGALGVGFGEGMVGGGVGFVCWGFHFG